MLRITIRGARGTMPTPGPATVRFGGNTPCVEVEAGRGEARIILDAGTGARSVGRSPLTRLFLTHYHWDHIQGLPFLIRSLGETALLEVRGPGTSPRAVEDLLRVLAAPPFFPVPLGALGAQLRFEAARDEGEGGPWSEGGVRVRWMRVRHPGPTLAYRVEEGIHSLVYAPDNELSRTAFDPGSDWSRRFHRFVEGSDLLVHDAMCTEGELTTRRGWGHSSMEEAVDLAAEAEVSRVLLFHHAPERTDEELAAREDALRERGTRARSRLEVAFAVEGARFELGDDEGAAERDAGVGGAGAEHRNAARSTEGAISLEPPHP